MTQVPDPLETEAAQLIAKLGERVRRARERKGIPRRVLSDLSGVSPRYLAQLEAGTGNISVALLSRVAHALDLRPEWLLSQDDPWASDVVQATELFRDASPDLRRQVLSLLQPGGGAADRAHRIALVGLRGAGKSTLGRMAAQALNLPFVELNEEIEAQGGMPVDEIMALYGPEGYRKLEAQALDRVTRAHETMVLAVAGGIVAEADTYETLLARCHTIWVRTSPDEHMARVRAQGDTRPMAGNPEAMEQLRAILVSRTGQYQKALAQLDTSGRSAQRSLEDLLALIQSKRFLA